MDSSDAGGVAAKHGFLYQDCVAAHLVAKMLFDKKMISVSFEVVDDIDVDWGTHLEFIQVKAAGDKSWTPTVITTCSSSTTSTSKRRQKVPNSSLVHKQMLQAKPPTENCLFRVITATPPKGKLEYLLASRSKRADRGSDRAVLLADLDRRMKNFVATAGNDVQHWLDSAWWQVFHTIEEIEASAIRLIHEAASDVAGIPLGYTRHVEAIWRDILFTVTKRGALSRSINCVDDKTYLRSELLRWFRDEVAYYEAHAPERTKVYVRRLPARILLPLTVLPSPTGRPTRNGTVLHQTFSLGRYRYEYIAESFREWLDEVLLLPKEIADLSHIGVEKKYRILVDRLSEQRKEFAELMGRVLLHSAIRHERQSQPIPAALYTDHPAGVKLLDNVHIVVNQPEPDELWVGISHILEGPTAPRDLICVLRDDLYGDILDHIDPIRRRILHVKEDSYLLAHDVDQILQAEESFTLHGSRFQFKIFFCYETAVVPAADSLAYEAQLVAEATQLLEKFCDDAAHADKHEVHISVYLYPVPSLVELSSKIQDKLNALH